MRTRTKWWSAWLVTCLLCLISPPSNHAEAEKTDPQKNNVLDPFFGSFVGYTHDVVNGKPERRDLDVTISPYKRSTGFSITWITVIYSDNRAESGVRRRVNTLYFSPTQQSGIYKLDEFNDPFRTNENISSAINPLIWAQVEGNKMNIYALVVHGHGAFTFKRYKRSIEHDGIALEFEDYNEQGLHKTVKGRLTRVVSDSSE